MARFRPAQFTPPVKAKTSARWAFVMEALRAAIKHGPRAALTRWGVEGVPEPGENTGWEEMIVLCLLRKHKRSGGNELLPSRWLAFRNETIRKLV